jgi:hypothetical protein
MIATRGVPVAVISLSCLFFAASAQAQVSPNLTADSFLQSSRDMIIVMPPHISADSSFQSPSRYRDTVQVRPHLGKVFWLGWGLAGALSVASIEMTAHCEHMSGCSEGNPVFGREPSRLELYAPRAAVIATGMLFCRHWKRRNPNDDTPTITVLSVDAIWAADAAWDAHQLIAARKSEPAALARGPVRMIGKETADESDLIHDEEAKAKAN